MKSPGTEEFRKVGRGVLEGRKCWFAMESKTFEISIEEVQGKQRGTIVERSKVFSS